MAPSTVHLPNGHTLTVTPVFGGLAFKANELATSRSHAFPPGWSIVLNEEDEPSAREWDTSGDEKEVNAARKGLIHRYKKPTLHNDHLYISAISNPPDASFRPASSPTRHIAMMLWATLWWYFHQPEPSRLLSNDACSKTAEEGRPRGEWIININREGVFKGKNVLAKLERMGLITSEDSSVGPWTEDSGAGWTKMFISRRAFWQINPRIFLFSLPPAYPTASIFAESTPMSSRPGSPMRSESPHRPPSYIEDTVRTHAVEVVEDACTE